MEEMKQLSSNISISIGCGRASPPQAHLLNKNINKSINSTSWFISSWSSDIEKGETDRI